MSNELFNLEIFLNKIIFFEPPQPSKKHFSVECSFGAYKFTIDSSVFDDDELSDQPEEEIVIRAGKSFLFITKNQSLVLVMGQPLQFKFYNANEFLGTSTTPWNDNFLELVHLASTVGRVKPASSEATLKINSKDEKHIGSVDVYIRLSSLGESFETFYQVKDVKTSSCFNFGNENTTNILRCAKQDSKMIPVGVVYNPAVRYPEKEQRYSIYYSTGTGDSDTGSIVSAFSLDSQRNLKFMDLHNMIHDAVDELDVDQVVQVELTADKINRLICNKTHCPVASKFAEYGIGPTATGKGLGTVYNYVKPPVTYGMSQSYGTLSNYGPFGLLEDHVIETTEETMKTSQCHICSNTPSEQTLCSLCQLKSQESIQKPLRLTGGGPVRERKKNIEDPVFDFRVMLKQYDNIVSSYRATRAECNMTYCPLAEGPLRARCQKFCDQPYEPDKTDMFSCLSIDCPFTNNLYARHYTPNEEELVQEKVSCHEVECPLMSPHDLLVMRKFNQDKIRPACGNTQCPYKKLQNSMVDADVKIESQFMPMPTRTCGQPNCDYEPQKELPPIHWDCPDPLPKDICKNPKCPYGTTLPKVPQSPCGNNDCPYTLPPPCDVPTCPFRERPCPYKKKKCVTNLEDDCNDPECAFTNVVPCCPPEPVGNPLTDLPCCGNPNCPLTNPRAAKLNPRPEKCYNLDCPFSQPPEPPKKDPPQINYDCGEPPVENNSCDDIYPEDNNETCVCGEPLTCKDDADLCLNPACPTKLPCGERKKQDICNNPDCPYNRDDDCLECPNPFCPRNDKFIVDSCTNRDCPYNKYKRKRQRQISKLCNNPKCKFFKMLFPEAADISEDENGEGDSEYSCKPSCGEVKATKKKIKTKGRYVYSIGDQYPGLCVGHQQCVMKRVNVPPHMGWLWNKPSTTFKPKKGWVPGAIGKTIAQRIREHRQKQGLGLLRLPIFSRGGVGGIFRSISEVNIVPRPTLTIKKKDDTIYVTLNPLKDPNTLVQNEDPYMNCNPLSFQITRQVKDKDMCECNDDDKSTDSDLDIEFTPPAGIISPERFKRMYNVVHCFTQYEVKDFEKKKKGDKKKKKDKKDKKGKKGDKSDKEAAKGADKGKDKGKGKDKKQGKKK